MSSLFFSSGVDFSTNAIYSVYFITSTLKIPAGTQMVGEGWTVIMGGGSAFNNVNNPTVMVQAGAPGSSGILEITDIVFTTQGPGEFNTRGAPEACRPCAVADR